MDGVGRARFTVAMLPEGWDTNTVTHILGLRAVRPWLFIASSRSREKGGAVPSGTAPYGDRPIDQLLRNTGGA